jgi:serine/threonine-protein kinase RsbT
VTTSTTATEAASRLLGVLSAYFSEPIARALLTSTLRRSSLSIATLEPGTLPDAIAALERALPLYIADATRRDGCNARLRGLLPRPRTPTPQVKPRLADVGLDARPSAATTITIASGHDVVNACEVARDLAHRVGFPPVVQTKIATACAELARNIVLYAGVGDMQIASLDAPRRGVEVLARDQGPGIRDIDVILSEKYKSQTGMGMGLLGTKRLMDSFEVETSPVGTAVRVRKYLA